MITYRATPDVPRETVYTVSRWLATHRRIHDIRPWQRAATPFVQAVLVLRWFKDKATSRSWLATPGQHRDGVPVLARGNRGGRRPRSAAARCAHQRTTSRLVVRVSGRHTGALDSLLPALGDRQTTRGIRASTSATTETSRCSQTRPGTRCGSVMSSPAPPRISPRPAPTPWARYTRPLRRGCRP